jgi:hypothetical protein
MNFSDPSRANHSTDLGRKWWDAVGRGIVDPDFAELLDELLLDAGPDDTYKRMATWADSEGARCRNRGHFGEKNRSSASERSTSSGKAAGCSRSDRGPVPTHEKRSARRFREWASA